MKQRLYEVWGDTVDERDLALAILIGAVVSVGAFLAAQALLLRWLDTPQMARAYAMLVGIVGCLLAGTLSACLFKPKRIVSQHQADPTQRAQLLDELREEFGDLGRLVDLPAAAVAELKEIGLYDLFAEEERRRGATQPQPVHKDPLQSALLAAKGGRP